jgi:hypothetical protein
MSLALTISSPSIDNLFSLANVEIQKLCTYFRSNKLSLHPDKTKYLFISHSNANLSQDHQIFINNNNLPNTDPTLIFPLSRVTEKDKIPAIKYLGIYFDENLNFKYQITQLSNKLSNALYILRRVKNFIPSHSLKTLYYSLFHSHLLYGIEIWSCAPPSAIKPLITKQKSAIRLISNAAYNAHTEPLFKLHSILPLSDLIISSNLKFFHSYVYNYIPTAFAGLWPTTIEQRFANAQAELVYNLRNSDDFFVPPSRTVTLSRYPLFNLPQLWNNNSPTLKSVSSKPLFTSHLKQHQLAKLNDTPNCHRLLCPSCTRF